MQTLPETHSEVCKQRFTVYTKEAGPASGSPGSLGSIERPLGGICCWQNQPFRPPGLKEPVKQNQPFRSPAKALGERVSANPWPQPSWLRSKSGYVRNVF